MINWDKILSDFAHRCGNGGPDMTNPRHLALLRESLIKFGWEENATNEFIGNLREGEKNYADNAKNRTLGRVGLPWGSKGTPPETDEPKDEEEVESTPINRKDSMDKSSEHIQEEKSEGQKKKDKKSKDEYDKLKEENKDLDSKERKVKSEKIVSSKLSSEDKATQLAGLVDGTIETTVTLIESVNDGLDTGRDLPAGTPESTFAEKGGVQRARTIQNEIADKRSKMMVFGFEDTDVTDEEVIDAMADDEVANPKSPLSKGKSKAWVKTMLRTAAAQQKSLDDNAEEYDCGVPAEILGGGVSDERTIAILKSQCDSEIEAAQAVLDDEDSHTPEEIEAAKIKKDHYEFTKKWLDNPDTDSFLLYKTKDGHMGVKHISNKKGFKDPALNTSVLQRGRKTKEKAREVAKERKMSEEDTIKMEENLEKTTEDSHKIVKDADASMTKGNQDVSKLAVKSKHKRIEELEAKQEDDTITEEELEEKMELQSRKTEAEETVESATVERDQKDKKRTELDKKIKDNKETIDSAFEVLDKNGKPDPDRSGLRKGEEIGRAKGRWYFWDDRIEDWKVVGKVILKNKLGKEKVTVNGEEKRLNEVVIESDNAGKEIGVLDTVIKHGEGILRNTDEFGEVLTSGVGGLPGQTYKEKSDYAIKVLNTSSNGGGRKQIEPFLKHCGWNGSAKELQDAIKEARKNGDMDEVRRLNGIVARAVSMTTASGTANDDTSKLTTKFSQKLTEIRNYDENLTQDEDGNPEGTNKSDVNIVKGFIKNGCKSKKDLTKSQIKSGYPSCDPAKPPMSFDEAKKLHIMKKYNIQSEEEYQAMINQGEHLGALTGDGDSGKSTWKQYTGSMAAAHKKMVGDIVGRDDKWKKKQKWEDDDPRHDENGPEAEAYVRTFMDQMHWEQYILGEAPRKAQSIDGHEVTPKMYYKCLSKLAESIGPPKGFNTDGKLTSGSKEHREALVKWLGKNAKPHPDDDSISIGPDIDPKDGRPDMKLGKDEMRTAGTAKKAHGYNGDDLTECLMEESGAK